jgi:hypothetical protein
MKDRIVSTGFLKPATFPGRRHRRLYAQRSSRGKRPDGHREAQKAPSSVVRNSNKSRVFPELGLTGIHRRHHLRLPFWLGGMACSALGLKILSPKKTVDRQL